MKFLSLHIPASKEAVVRAQDRPLNNIPEIERVKGRAQGHNSGRLAVLGLIEPLPI